MKEEKEKTPSQSSETTEERFYRERQEVNDAMDAILEKMRGIFTCSEALVMVLSKRQELLDYSHVLMGLLSKQNVALRAARVERTNYYSMEYDYKLSAQEKENFILHDIRRQVVLQELLDSHLKFMRGSIDTCDKMGYAIKLKLEFENYRRDKN